MAGIWFICLRIPQRMSKPCNNSSNPNCASWPHRKARTAWHLPMRGDGMVGDDNDMSVSLILRKQHSALRQKQKKHVKKLHRINETTTNRNQVEDLLESSCTYYWVSKISWPKVAPQSRTGTKELEMEFCRNEIFPIGYRKTSQNSSHLKSLPDRSGFGVMVKVSCNLVFTTTFQKPLLCWRQTCTRILRNEGNEGGLCWSKD